jgi:cysteinyl-tRNA synthetase
LQVEGEKMSKSAGNFFTVRDFVAPESEGGKGIDPLALRLTLISGQYRKPFNFTFDTLKANARHVQRFREAAARVAARVEADADGEDLVGDRLGALYTRALDAMRDDLNTPEAIAAVLDGVKLLNGISDNLNGASARSAQTWLDQINDLLGIIHPETTPMQPEAETNDPLADKIEALLTERKEARANKDFARADAIRAEIDAMGIEVMDSPEGSTWRRKSHFGL